MRPYLFVLLVACAAPARTVGAPATATPVGEPFPLVTVYRLDLADEPWDEHTLRDSEALDDAWMARPDAPIRDWPHWLATMRAHGIRSFDLGAAEVIDWQALSHETVVRLSLAGRRLDAEAKAYLATASSLRWLDLSQTRATDDVCASLVAQPLLQRVALSRTGVGDKCVAALVQLQRLERLSLDHTGVTDAGVAKLVMLPLLSDIVLNSTAITDKSVIVLLDHFALKRLDVNDTATAKVATRVTRTTSLERIDLGDTKVSPRVVSSLMRHPYLRFLSLCGVSIDNGDLVKVATLRRLEVLDLGGTRIDTILPLEGMERLTHLSVANTAVANLSPLQRIPSLRYLDLSATPVRDLDAVAVLSELRVLDVSKTAVRSVAPLASLSHVRELQLGYTKIEDAALRDLTALTELTTLSLSACELRDVSVFGDMPSLRVLALVGVGFRPETLRLPAGLVMLNVNDSSFANLDVLPPSLRALHVGHTSLVDLKSLARLSQLTALDVSGLAVDRDQLASWKLPRLRVLNASQTKLRQLSGAGLPRTLETLYLIDLDITDADLPTRAELPNLEHLDVTGTRVTPQGLSARGF